MFQGKFKIRESLLVVFSHLDAHSHTIYNNFIDSKHFAAHELFFLKETEETECTEWLIYLNVEWKRFEVLRCVQLFGDVFMPVANRLLNHAKYGRLLLYSGYEWTRGIDSESSTQMCGEPDASTTARELSGRENARYSVPVQCTQYTNSVHRTVQIVYVPRWTVERKS